MELKIKIHSLIDVITNSSTEIFINMHKDSVEKMFEILNEVLKVAGSDKKAEDLFDVEIEQDWDCIIDRFLDDDKPINDEEKSLLSEYNNIDDYPKTNNFVDSQIIPYLKKSGRWKDFNTSYEGYEASSYLTIVAKDTDASTVDLWNKIINLFEVEAIYN